jgi:hypothetical protein
MLHTQLNSIVDNKDIKTVFLNIVHYFDPNRNQNKKTKVLDSSFSNLWNEKELRLYDITKTNNLKGLFENFDIIIYEIPYSKKFMSLCENAIHKFQKNLNDNGAIIVKCNDFKEKYNDQLRGSFDVYCLFKNNDFYLSNKIIYKFSSYSNIKYQPYDIPIIHTNFMIFKKEQ